LNSPTHENIDQWLFDRIEGNLSFEQEQELSLFLLLNPSYDIDLDAWEKSKVNFPEIDPALVESMGFGVKEVEKERKKRPIGMWIFASSLTLILCGLFISIGDGASISEQKANQNAQTKQSLVVSTKKGNGLQYGSNQNTSTAYPFTYMTENILSSLGGTINNMNSIHSNNLVNNNTFSTPEIAQTLQPSSVLKSSHPELIALHIDKPIILNQELQSESLLSSQADAVNEKHKIALNLPSFKLSRSSTLSKYLRKDVLSATQKDRVFFVQEKSHLDIADAFVGNRSQTRIQSTTMARWLGNANQKLTQQFSVDGYSRNLKSGFGMVANYVDFGKGAITDWNVRLIFSPKLAFGKYVSIEPAVSYLVGQKSINSNKITNHSLFEFSSNQLQQFNYNSTNAIGNQLYYRDLNAGVNVNAGPVYLGISTQNILKHQDNVHTNDFDTIHRAAQTSTLYIGTDFSARKGTVMFSPMLSHTIGLTSDLTQIGGTMQLNGVVIGANYGSNASFGALFGYQSKNFSIIAQSLKTKPLTSIQPQYVHQLTLRINTNISRKTRRYLYL
jgi:hypothetical protein